MKRSNRLVILVGVLLAVLAFVGIVILLNQEEPRWPPDGGRTTVLVAIDDIAIGDPVTPDLAEDPRGRRGSRGADTDCAIHSLLTGSPAPVPMVAGEQITAGEGRPGRRTRSTSSSPAGAGREGHRLPGRPGHRPRLPDHARRPHRHRHRPGRDAHPADSGFSRGAAEQPRRAGPLRSGHRTQQRPDGQDDHPGPARPVRQPDARNAACDRRRQAPVHRPVRQPAGADRQRDHRLRRQRPGCGADQVRAA